MLRCDEVTRLYASDEIRRAWRKRIAVRLHLALCSACRRYVREIDAIGDAARSAAGEHTPAPEEVEALLRRVLPRGAGDP